MKRREYLKQAAFSLALIAAAAGLLLIVPRNKALLWAIIGTVLILFVYSSLNMLRSRRVRIDYAAGALKKEKTATLRLSKWGGSFRIGKTPLSYEMVRPFTVFI